MKIKDKVLIVEDEQSISSFISMILTANGYDTIIVNTGEEALTMISSHCPDLIVLDLGLPDMDGLEVLRSVRKWSSLPIVVVSARNHERDKVEALDYGADDYLVKPINVNELVLRINALLRRAQMVADRRQTLGTTTFEFDSFSVLTGGVQTVLPQKEFLLLYKLVSSPGHIFTRQQLMDDIWGIDTHTDPRTVDVHINRLRDRFRENQDFEIITVRGIGYKAERKHEEG